ncbi:MAG: hypothetical protein V1809_14470 [Planctomycetota bacterium]
MFSKSGHVWNFFRAGGLDQALVDSAGDLACLAELDPKHWVALSCPVSGLEFDLRTLELIDTDGDGRIRVPEILAAAALVSACLKEPADIRNGAGALTLAAIADTTEPGKAALASARWMLAALGRPEAPSVSLADVAAMTPLLARHRALGDGVISPDAAEDAAARRVLEEIAATPGPEAAGKAKGINEAGRDRFFRTLVEFSEWWKGCEGAGAPAVMPFGADTPEAFAAYEAVQTKIEDYFTRCKLAEFDPRAGGILNRSESDYAPLAANTLTVEIEGIAGLPLAQAGPRHPLPLSTGLNPAWAERISRFRARVVAPLVGDGTDVLTEADWSAVKRRLAPHTEWRKSRKGAEVEKLGIARVREILAGDARARMDDLFQRNRVISREAARIESVERLVRYHRDLHALLRNFVNFANFYDPATPTVFDAGRLYLDQRTCHLCVRVENPAGHATFAGLSRMYLAYCDCTRPGGGKMTIVAAFTQGDSESLTVGRNGIFYDRQGRDWDATVVKVIENPISIRQAFWMPYKRLSRFISDQIEKFGAAKDKAAHEAATAQVSGALPAAEAGKPGRKEPFDIAKFAGIFAAIGLAVGAIGGALAAMLAAFFKLEWWQMPMALAGIIIAVSGPAMIIAWLKLRQRTLVPVLEGNGWAINGRVKINIPLGKSLTELRRMPANARLSLKDPFSDKAARRRRYYAVIILLLIAAAIHAWRAEIKSVVGRIIHAAPPAATADNPASSPVTPK